MEPQTVIARRIAQELAPGMLVNLGIGTRLRSEKGPLLV